MAGGCMALARRQGRRFNIDDDDLGARDAHKFTYKELALGTKKLDVNSVAGRGESGKVYKGLLAGNKQAVAEKRLSAESKRGEREFQAELTIIGLELQR